MTKIAVFRQPSAVLMYRKQVRHRIKGGDVLEFLLKNPDFPGSVNFCLQELGANIQKLPNSQAIHQNLTQLQHDFMAIDIKHVAPSELHTILDGLQVSLNSLHDLIQEAWFLK